MIDGKIELLLIEDNPDDIELLQRSLGKSVNVQFSVKSVQSMKEALDHLAGNKPDIILSDLGLPDSHGLDTVTKLLCDAPNIPLVVLSGFDDEVTAIKAVQSGAQDYLVKGHLEGRQLERSLFYAIERAQLQTELEQHAQEISGIQSNLLKILDKNADAIIIVAGKDRKILFTNPAAEALFGRQKKGLINKIFEFPLDGGKTSEIEISPPSREKTVAEMSVVEISWEGQRAYLASLRDITRRKKMEEKLRFSDTALNSIRQGVFAIDNEYKITRWNEMCEQMFGVTASEAIGRVTGDIITMVEEYPGQNEERFSLLLEKGFNREEQIYRTPRGDIWVDVHAQAIEENGKRYGWVSLVSDITERKKTEEELRFSHAAFGSIHESIIATDTKYVITHWNEISEKIYGIKAAEAIGRKLRDIVEIEESLPGENDRRFERLESDGYYRQEQLHRTRYGEVWVDVSIQAIEENGKRYGWVMLASAITQRKLAEEALKRSEEKYRELISTSTDGIISADPQMKITIWNQGAEKIFGYTEKEMLGQSVLKIIPGEKTKEGTKEFLQLSKVGVSRFTSKVTETSGLKKNGTEFPIEVSVSTRKAGDTYSITIIMRDITERKEAEEALKCSEEKYRELIDTSSDGIVSTDSQMRFVVWNRGAEKMLGYTEKEILGQSIMNIIAEADRNAVSRELIRSKQREPGSVVSQIFEIQGMKKDCSPVPMEVSLSTRKSEDKSFITAIMRDITVRKEAEEKLRKIAQMKSEFLSNVSHELRTPLQSISGFTKLIMNGQVPDPATQQEFFQIIDRETQHLGSLINGLLDLSRLESGRFQINRKPTAMRETMIDAIKSFHTLARDKNITLNEDIPDELPEMEVDDERMRQVFFNLISNAIKYSDAGGSVTVKAEEGPGELIFQVSDHGIGMSPEAMKHLFERFYRAEENPARSGTGLGLYITKQIIDAHGGRIRVESKVNQGSTFSFTLPYTRKGGNGHGKKDIDHRRRPSDIKAR